MTVPQPITRHAPGKLFIVGEYAVMEPGSPAILVAVDRLVSVTASAADADGVTISSDLCPAPVHLQWRGVDLVGRTSADEKSGRGALAHVVAAVEVVAQLLAHRDLPMPTFDLAISSELHDSGMKLGLGSSGAVTAAVVAAVAGYCGLELTRDARFRLAMIASARLDPQGSGADLAASTWRGWVLYHAPDRAAVLDLVGRLGIDDALDAVWPGLAVHRLAVPRGLTLQVGWTGRPVSTRELVGGPRANAWRGSALHQAFVADMTECVLATASALERGDRPEVVRQIRTARELLAGLDKAARLGIFTDKLIALCEAADAIGWAAKPSGAGGGDCGVALLDTADERDIERLRTRWAAAGIQRLPVEVLGDEMDAQ